MSWQTPATWKTVTLADVCYRIVDGSHNPPPGQSSGKPMLSAKNIQNGKIHFDELRLLSRDDFERENKRTNISAGDVLLTIVGALGRTAVVPETHPEFTLQRSVAVLKSEVINPNYLRYLLDSPVAQTFFLENAKGTAQKGIYLKALGGMQVPIAPLAEQTRIAQKLDELLAQVDTLKARIDAIPALLKRFRQSVLAAAVSGRLTEEWRAQNVGWVDEGNPTAVPDQDTDRWVSQAQPNLRAELFDSHYNAVPLGELADFQNGFAFKSQWFQKEGEIQVVKIGNVRDGKTDMANSPSFVSSEIAHESHRFLTIDGDILISMTGTKYKRDYGFACPVAAGVLVNQRVGKFRANTNKISSQYLLICLRSSIFREQFFKGETGQVSQGNVGSEHIKKCMIPAPKIDEQTEIVRRVEQLFAFTDQLEAKIKTAQARINHLTQSILAKAFRGELVPQDPNDEPASELLARIQAQRANAPKAKRGRKQVQST